MSNNPSGSNAHSAPQPQPQAQLQTGQQTQAELPGHGVLEEDDEFEEFEAQDWQDSATSLSHIGNTAQPSAGGGANPSMIGERGAKGGATTGTGAGANDHLWEDNWDDDDVEDDFSLALRAELEKTSQAMST